jgi:formate/nitrite transporter FocA (FNT family)
MNSEENPRKEAGQRALPAGAAAYHVIRREGEEELRRPFMALAWSGLAAGLSMGFALIAQGLLYEHIDDWTTWRPLAVALGYSLGFLLVVLGRLQLFTTNTFTVILPLLRRPRERVLRRIVRLWITVLLANLAGALIAAAVLAETTAVETTTNAAILRVAQATFGNDFRTVLLRGAFAGWLITMMIWLLPLAGAARVWVIILTTWLSGAAGFAHPIAGGVAVFYLAFRHNVAWLDCWDGYIIPAIIGNIIGGVALVAAVHAAHVSRDPHLSTWES